MCFLALLSFLEGGDFITEYFTEGNIPKQLSQYSDQGDLTVITIRGWPAYGEIILYESSLIKGKTLKTTFSKSRGEDVVSLIGSIGYIPGLSINYTYKNSKNRLTKEIKFIPARILAKSIKDHAEIEAELVSFHPVMYRIYLRGFSPNEELVYRSKSYHEVNEGKINSTSIFVTLPEVIGKRGGVEELSLIRPSGEILRLELPWGLEWTKYNKYYDKDGSVITLSEDPEFLKENPEIAEYFASPRK